MWKIPWIFPVFVVSCLGLPTSNFDNDLYQIVNRGINRGSRISGGTEALRNQFPYQVAFFIYTSTGQSICGGSILSTNFVLSAAHCFLSFESADLLAGIHDIINDNPAYELEVFPTDIVLHAGYNRQTQLNDIALVRTSRRPFTFNTMIQALPLAPRSMSNTDITSIIARVAGWGRTSDSTADISPRLLFIDAPIISNAACTTIFGNVITSGNVCLSGASARSTCQGDSGGPLTITNGGRQVHVGIVSFGSDSGCQRGYPTVFTRITAFHNWIQTNTGVTIP